jgi:hypothetical protein
VRAIIAAILAAAALSGQTQPAPATEKQPDRATAYFHFTLAHLYAEMAATSMGGNREYLEKAIENHRIAVEADPRTPPLRMHHSRRFPAAQPRLEREAPKQP